MHDHGPAEPFGASTFATSAGQRLLAAALAAAGLWLAVAWALGWL
ncbi:MAG: hypothetical protein AB7R90_01540 [Reyranellaceae bacterium]